MIVHGSRFTIHGLCELILLAAIPYLMFCVIPVHGMEFRFSWQLASIWLGGIAFCAFLSSWWLRLFFLFALFKTATIGPIMDAYISLMMIAIFFAAIEGYKRIDERKILACMCIAAGALLIWIGVQKLGFVFPEGFSGPFNCNAAGIFLALTLPAFFHKKRFYAVPFIFIGIAVIGASTGFMAAIASIFVAGCLYKKLDRKTKILILLIIYICAELWCWKIDPIKNIDKYPRLTAWKHAVWSLRSEGFGRGLGSWKMQFPLLVSGEKSLGTVTNEDGKITMINVMAQAHNEYVHIGFELGLHTVLLIGLFLLSAAIIICCGGASPHAAGGFTALAVSCFGWHVFHIAPLALLGCAWLGIWMKGIKTVHGSRFTIYG